MRIESIYTYLSSHQSEISWTKKSILFCCLICLIQTQEFLVLLMLWASPSSSFVTADNTLCRAACSGMGTTSNKSQQMTMKSTQSMIFAKTCSACADVTSCLSTSSAFSIKMQAIIRQIQFYKFLYQNQILPIPNVQIIQSYLSI